jgi:hypothetical protein
MIQIITVAIEFAGAEATAEPGSRVIRLTESSAGNKRIFTLRDGRRPARVLSASEMEQLLRLLGQMAIGAPWQSLAGCDGRACALVLRGPASEARFH